MHPTIERVFLTRSISNHFTHFYIYSTTTHSNRLSIWILHLELSSFTNLEITPRWRPLGAQIPYPHLQSMIAGAVFYPGHNPPTHSPVSADIKKASWSNIYEIYSFNMHQSIRRS